MTIWGRLLCFFSLVQIVLCLGSFCLALTQGQWFYVMLALFFVYIFPILCFRLHSLFWPLVFGVSDISSGYSPWWASYQMQRLFIALPSLEALLRLLPGVYSFWLRLWGAKIGKGVLWTPRVEILDRSLLEIGDRVIVGHEVKFIGHFIRLSASGRLKLYVNPVKVGAHAFLGAGSRLGPGASVEPGARLAILTDVKQNGIVKSDANFPERTIVAARRKPAWQS